MKIIILFLVAVTVSFDTEAVAKTTTGKNCKQKCHKRDLGYFQSCDSCNKYITCVGKIRYEMPCAKKFVWDDVKKECLWRSTTCSVNAKPAKTTTGKNCKQKCHKRDLGYFQSCDSCNKYITCVGKIWY